MDSKVTLNTGYDIPLVGYGCWQISGEEGVVTFKQALKVGFRNFDTAQFYGNEKELGLAVIDSGVPRSDIVIATKIYQGCDTPEAVEANITNSLQKFGLGYIDLFLLHSALVGLLDKRKMMWASICELSGEGKMVRSPGVSNFGIRHLEELRKAGLRTPAVNQLEVHPYCQQREIVEYCKAHGILVQAYCPLMRGSFGIPSFGEGASWTGEPGKGWDDPVFIKLAAKHKKTVPQILIRWSLQKGFNPLPKSATPQHMVENTKVFDFALSAEDMQELDDLDMGAAGALEWNPVDAP